MNCSQNSEDLRPYSIKNKLSFDQQIEKMKIDGIKFDIMSTAEAKQFLASNNYFFKLKSYSKNYQKNDNGKFSEVDFAYLVELSILDTHFRSIVLDLCLSIEHQLKVMLMREITEDDEEDGYSIVEELFNKYPYIRDNLEHKRRSATRDLWIHNNESLSVWVFLEICSYDSFIKLYDLYFSKGRSDAVKDLRELDRLIYSSKFLRNSAAHNNCLLNSLRQNYTDNGKTFQPSKSVINEVRELFERPSGTLKRTIKRQMSNHIIHDFVATLLLFRRICKSQKMFRNVMEDIYSLFVDRFRRHQKYFENEEMLRSRYRFVLKVIDEIRETPYDKGEDQKE